MAEETHAENKVAKEKTKSKPKGNEDTNEDRAKEETHAQKIRRWKHSSIIAGIIVVADLGIFYLGIVATGGKTAIPLSLSIVGIGIITFFGMLSLATFQSTRQKEEGKPEKDEGHMRTALAGTLVCVYIVVLVLSMTQDISGTVGEGSILQHFSEVIMVVIVFYFGPKAAKEIAQAYANKGKTSG